MTTWLGFCSGGELAGGSCLEVEGVCFDVDVGVAGIGVRNVAVLHKLLEFLECELASIVGPKLIRNTMSEKH